MLGIGLKPSQSECPPQLSEDTLAMLSKLGELHKTFGINGGFARDRFFERKPRDIDVQVYGFYDRAELDYTFHIFARWLDKKGLIDATFVTGEDYSSLSNVVGVIKVRNIDFIFYDEEVGTHDDLMHNFDYNINMFNYDWKSGVTQYLGPMKTWGLLFPIKPASELTEERQNRMTTAAQAVGWEVPTERVLNNLLPLREARKIRNML